MIKRLIMKLMKKNINLREYVIDGCIANDLLLQEQKVQIISDMNLNGVIKDVDINNKNIVISNCLIINTKISDSTIPVLQNNYLYNTSITNNMVKPEKEEKIEIPIFMK